MGACEGEHLVVEVVKEPEHAMLVIWVSFVDVLQQLDLIKALIKVVFVVLQSASMPFDWTALTPFAQSGMAKYISALSAEQLNWTTFACLCLTASCWYAEYAAQ